MLKKIPIEPEAEWLKKKLGYISSTEIDALMQADGRGRWESYYSVWDRKKNLVPYPEKKEKHISIGKNIEPFIGNMVVQEKGWEGEKYPYFLYCDERRIGSSFDWRVKDETGYAFLEIKNVGQFVFLDEWDRDPEGNFLPPENIYLQCQFQMMLTKQHYMYLGALEGGARLHIIKIDMCKETCDAMETACAKFWEKVDSDEQLQPSLDKDWLYLLEKYAEVPRAYERYDVNPRFDDLASEYHDRSVQIRELQKENKIAKAQIITEMKDAGKYVTENWTVNYLKSFRLTKSK